MSRLYRVTHTTRYSYEEDVTESYGQAHLTPRDDAGQTCLSHALTVRPRPQLLADREDFYGNRTTYLEVLRPHTELVITATSTVRVDREQADPAGCVVPWEKAGAAAVAELDRPAEALRALDFQLASAHVPFGLGSDGARRRDADLRSFTAEMFTPGRPAGEAVRDLVARIYRDFTYRPGSTSVTTTPSEVLRRREGVCQDFAHLALAVLRSVGLPARYVSGYLETLPPPGRPKLVGSDASHAWVSVLLPGLGWIDLDPTNDRIVDASYVVTAWGRDYSDVPPLKGVIFSEGSVSTLAVAVDVVPLAGSGSAPTPRGESRRS